jgi:REP element-mobilizing transposase RayT
MPLKSLLQRVIFPGGRDEDTLTTLAARLARLDREIDPAQRSRIVADSGGHTPANLAGALLRAFDPDEVAAASRRLLLDRMNDATSSDDYGSPAIGYFDPTAPVENLTGDLPHWRQKGVTYFVTFRLSDSLPQEKLAQWKAEKEAWLAAHPEPHDEATREDFYNRFPARMQRWMDAGHGSCILNMDPVRQLVENAIRHFDGDRYALDEFVVAANHVHVLVTPLGDHTLSEILHSWKSYTAHEILKMEPAARSLAAASGKAMPVSYSSRAVPALAAKKQSRDGSATSATLHVWQKESFDHIVRSPASLEKFREYIRAHTPDNGFDLCVSEDLRRDAAATLIAEACAPFDKPALRQTLENLKREAEQTIDIYTPDEVIEQGFDEAAKAKAAGLVQAFRDYLTKNQAEIDALQILYSRPYKQRLTEPMLKDLEKKLRETHATWTEDRLWDAYAVTTPGKVKGRTQAGRFADLVSLVRFALEQQPVLAPFADTVNERFDAWLKSKQSGSGVPPLSLEDQSRDGSATGSATFASFSAEQLSWLHLIRDHIATSLSIEPDDFDYAPFSQKGGVGKAHQLFGDALPALLEELNNTLAA